MVVELNGGGKADVRPGFQIKDGAVIGRSTGVNVVSIPIRNIHAILKIDGKNVLGRELPLSKKHVSCYPGAKGHAESPLANPPSASEIAEGVATRPDVSSI
ncbi:MAG: hypothetical protein PHE24_04420 [Patescibacteria group bacterium]|nr:hypothetical protein [Patescibacteria group bacterium]